MSLRGFRYIRLQPIDRGHRHHRPGMDANRVLSVSQAAATLAFLTPRYFISRMPQALGADHRRVQRSSIE